jgi:hypothetical protein
MAYREVLIYDINGAFLGSGIKRDGAIKLQTQNIWTEDEGEALEKQLALLNENQAVKGAWPDARDPDVVTLLNNPNFMPIETGPMEVVDEDASYLVFKQVPAVDEFGVELVPEQLVDGEDYDKDASVIVHKTIIAPLRQSDVGQRVNAACEQIAKQRSGVV